MKLLKSLLAAFVILTAVFIVIFVLYGLTLPKSFSVEKSIAIDAPAVKVFPYLADLKQHPKWSPWFEMDPRMERNYSGMSSAVGQKVVWASEKPEVGHGSQEITKIQMPTMIEQRLSFGKTGEYGGATARFDLTNPSTATTVTWSFQTDENGNLLSRYMGKFMMEKSVNDSFEQGLQKLKTLVESK